MSLVSKDSIIKACADAYKEGAGVESVKVGELASSILAALTSGGSLPEGWATGTFNATVETMKGNFQIEHGLEAVPDVVIIFCENNVLASYAVKGVFRLNGSAELDEESGLYYPAVSSGRMFYCNSAGTNIAQLSDNGAGEDTNKTIYIPYGNNYTLYVPAYTYRWIAIKLGA